ncbi:asparaginase [Marinomonas rhizomae]|uniref:asparaginase n=1 Tax=Marinomonas rhizomae TaxID=491948 RepID=UPI0021051341|nr:asparaginase [Marinomonas rhizomae]UTV98971.1 asparaginase [Marinomonas rhizomae]
MQHASLSVHVTRGGIVESEHSIKAVIVSSTGTIVESWGDVDALVYPRSAIKAMQALAFIEMGGAERFGFSNDEISICCASHNGEPEHVATVQSMLDKLASSEADFECGCHWPMRAEAGYVLAGEGKEPNQLHNNCSGKHAGMLGLAKLLGVSSEGYIGIDHPVQQKIAGTMADMCEYDYSTAPWSPDGCSAPTWAMPLTNLALAFAKFASPDSLSTERQKACKTLYDAVVEYPFMVAGTARYCTDMMRILQKRVFLKVGAEGVYVAAIPELKLAIALKCEDGAVRAAESVMTALLDHVGITTFVADNIMQKYRSVTLKNWEKRTTGTIVCQI